MRAFISYSLNDAEQYVLTVLARRLQEQGFVVSSSYNLFASALSNEVSNQINKSSLFIGLITATGNANNRVITEWQQALSKKIPSLLLVERTVPLKQSFQSNPNVVLFDRHNPEPSIALVRDRINQSRHSTQTGNDNTVAWLLGGLAVLALIGLLSKDD